ncbi:MAG: hypothetical protein MZW92_60070 [Comamonadaceae bacterium]|nr:hypothetical protein [Comamonadaceae bacterium]
MAALGNDGGDYLARLQGWGVDTSLVRVDRRAATRRRRSSSPTRDNNQITAFHPGAMQHAHQTPVPRARGDLTIGIIAPDGREAMLAARRADARAPASRSSSTRASSCRCSTAPSCARFVEHGAAGSRSTTTKAACCASAPGTTLAELSRLRPAAASW